MSIQPEWCELIASGKKTVEIRKNKPKLETSFKCFIYQTKMKWAYTLLRTLQLHKLADTLLMGLGKVIGEFVCDEIFPIRVFENGSIQDYMGHSMERSCVPYDDISSYVGKDKTGYGWHISDLVIYDKPKDLSEFYQKCKSYDKDEWDIENLDCIECENPCGNGGKLLLKRPPQSWCYVET